MITDAAAGRILAGVVAGLEAFDQGTGLDDYLDFKLTEPQLRRSISSILFSSFRHRVRLEKVLTALVTRPPRPEVRHLLLAALTQIFYSDGIAPESAVNVAVDFARLRGGKFEAGFVNAVLRRARENTDDDETTPEAVLPPEICRRWRRLFSPAELQQLADALRQEADNTFRCRLGAELTEDEVQALRAEKIDGAGGRWSFYRCAAPAALLASEGWRDGRFYLQDPAAATAVSLPDYREIGDALDICAAPGGKSLMIAEMLPPEARLVLADRSARRQELTRENFRRWKLDPVILVAEPEKIPAELGQFDLVLADVPCSNSGVYRRRPDALWRFNSAALPELLALQARLLNAAADRVRPGKFLLYSTCSIDPAENRDQVDRLLAARPEFTVVKEVRLLPDQVRDGAYGCLLQQCGEKNRQQHS